MSLEDFKEQLEKHRKQVQEYGKNGQLTDEAVTKQALILPFISILGYNITDPRSVKPEFTADYGIKAGKKVDYAILKDGKPIIFIEAKKYGENIANQYHDDQLHFYFNAETDVKLGILTNGLIYRFYNDSDKPNHMNKEPFLTLDFSHDSVSGSISEYIYNAIYTQNFDSEELSLAANQFKFKSFFKPKIITDLSTPTKEFLDYYMDSAKKQFGGLIDLETGDFHQSPRQSTKEKLEEQYYSLIKKAVKDAMTAKFTEMILTTQKNRNQEEEANVVADDVDTEEADENKIEESQLLSLVRGALIDDIDDIERINFSGNGQSYLHIGSNRQKLLGYDFPIGKGKKKEKSIVIYSADKDATEKKYFIRDINQVALYLPQIKERLIFLLKK